MKRKRGGYKGHRPTSGGVSKAGGTSKLSHLQEKMKARLQGSKFRWINEKLYTESGDASLKLFNEKPVLFDDYHEGFRNQVHKWPINPLDMITSHLLKYLSRKPGLVVADMGCGEAKLSVNIGGLCTIHSFDLVAANDSVVACNIAHVPLADADCDIVVFCLALMGVDFVDFLREAARITKTGGRLIIAEVTSRFGSPQAERKFSELVERQGFRASPLSKGLKSTPYFAVFEFTRVGKSKVKQVVRPRDIDDFKLKPCIYKKR